MTSIDLRWAAVAAGAAATYAMVLEQALMEFEPTPTAHIGLLLTVPPVGALFATDLLTRRLPRAISYGGLLVALPWLILSPHTHGGFWNPVQGMAAMTGVAFFMRWISRGSLGWGDVHFAPLLGAVLGWFSPSTVFSSWLVASFSCGLLAVLFIASGGNARSRLPFGPFLVVGICSAILFAGA